MSFMSFMMFIVYSILEVKSQNIDKFDDKWWKVVTDMVMACRNSESQIPTKDKI